MINVFDMENERTEYIIKYLCLLKDYFKDNIRRDISEFLVKTNFIDRDYVFNNEMRFLNDMCKNNTIEYGDCETDKERKYYKEIVKNKKQIKFYLSDNFGIKASEFYKKAFKDNYKNYPYNLVRDIYRKQIALENGIDPINCLFG
jgi:hypothetical protein